MFAGDRQTRLGSEIHRGDTVSEMRLLTSIQRQYLGLVDIAGRCARSGLPYKAREKYRERCSVWRASNMTDIANSQGARCSTHLPADKEQGSTGLSVMIHCRRCRWSEVRLMHSCHWIGFLSTRKEVRVVFAFADRLHTLNVSHSRHYALMQCKGPYRNAS